MLMPLQPVYQYIYFERVVMKGNAGRSPWTYEIATVLGILHVNYKHLKAFDPEGGKILTEGAL